MDTIRHLESNIQISQQKKQFQSTQLETIRQNLSQAAGRLDQLQLDVAAIQSEQSQVELGLLEADQAVVNHEEIFNSKQAEFNLLKSGVDQFQLDKQENETAIYELEKELAIQHNRIENLHADSKRCEEEIDSKFNEHQNKENQHKELSVKLKDVLSEIDQVKAAEENRLLGLEQVQIELEWYSKSFFHPPSTRCQAK